MKTEENLDNLVRQLDHKICEYIRKMISENNLSAIQCVRLLSTNISVLSSRVIPLALEATSLSKSEARDKLISLIDEAIYFEEEKVH